MTRKTSHFGRHAAIVGCSFFALVAAAWIALGYGGAVVAAVGGIALIGLSLPGVFIYHEEDDLLHPRGR